MRASVTDRISRDAPTSVDSPRRRPVSRRSRAVRRPARRRILLARRAGANPRGDRATVHASRRLSAFAVWPSARSFASFIAICPTGSAVAAWKRVSSLESLAVGMPWTSSHPTLVSPSLREAVHDLWSRRARSASYVRCTTRASRSRSRRYRPPGERLGRATSTRGFVSRLRMATPGNGWRISPSARLAGRSACDEDLRPMRHGSDRCVRRMTRYRARWCFNLLAPVADGTVVEREDGSPTSVHGRRPRRERWARRRSRRYCCCPVSSTHCHLERTPTRGFLEDSPSRWILRLTHGARCSRTTISSIRRASGSGDFSARHRPTPAGDSGSGFDAMLERGVRRICYQEPGPDPVQCARAVAELRERARAMRARDGARARRHFRTRRTRYPMRCSGDGSWRANWDFLSPCTSPSALEVSS